MNNIINNSLFSNYEFPELIYIYTQVLSGTPINANLDHSTLIHLAIIRVTC